MRKKVETKSINQQQEQKTWDIDLKTDKQRKGYVCGWANMYRKNGVDVIDHAHDKIMPKALDGTAIIPILYQHDTKLPVGRGVAYEKAENSGKDYGIWIEIQLAVDSESKLLRERAQEVYELVKSKIIPQMSIGFVVEKQRWEQENNKHLRVIEKMQLVETSFVIKGCNPYADVVGWKQAQENDQDDQMLSIMGQEYCTYGEFKEAMCELFMNPQAVVLKDYLENCCAKYSAVGAKSINWGMVATDSHLKEHALLMIEMMNHNYSAQSFMQDFIIKLAPLMAKRRIFHT